MPSQRASGSSCGAFSPGRLTFFSRGLDVAPPVHTLLAAQNEPCWQKSSLVAANRPGNVTPDRTNHVDRIGARRGEGAQTLFGNQTYKEAVLEVGQLFQQRPRGLGYPPAPNYSRASGPLPNI